ncbi:zinc-binding oxidoreductase CipB [Cryphonectria parasitica EP155]|uniref:Zinc-binding oxidoreductase CipB n=1 Tax=Cryphonectria parasitica (strain ATCC 38755 / EP155) TaxID=660469 RepID=A0A9P5CMU8_CRYP1|nr:zinc-binding oxidoreductase CipB [Cryphonectria parasitica EP155]KAF3763461.1 zinc-binding oxidoreductase CipB [Cryphonectria parasitica EP155]
MAAKTPENHAAWISKAKGPLSISPAPYTPPGPDQVVVRVHAIAMNLIDWMKQEVGDMMYGWIKYPFILGNDVAGEIVEVGTKVQKSGQFRPGQRVTGLALGMDSRSAKAAEGGFQEYVVLRSNSVSAIPDDMAYEKACVLPLCLSTAASGLFCDKYLALNHPSVENYIHKAGAGDVVVVWGASTAVGMNAVQLLVAAGYRVVATAGVHNFDTIRGLGATEVFSYRSKTCVKEIVDAVGRLTSDGRTKCGGAMAIGEASIKPCIEILATCCKGSERKFVASMSMDGPAKMAPGAFGMVSFLAKMVWAQITTLVKKTMKGVTVQFVWGTELVDSDVAKVVYSDFLPAALASGRFVPMPEPQVIGQGLEKVQEAFEVGKKGVSAKKIVITL